MIQKWQESGDLLLAVALAQGSQPNWSTGRPASGSDRMNATCDPWHARPPLVELPNLSVGPDPRAVRQEG